MKPEAKDPLTYYYDFLKVENSKKGEKHIKPPRVDSYSEFSEMQTNELQEAER